MYTHAPIKKCIIFLELSSPILFIQVRENIYKLGCENMRKNILWFAVLISAILLAQAAPAAYACHKTADLIFDTDGDGIIEVGELVVWQMAIVISNGLEEDWTDVVVTDRIAAELEIVSIDGAAKGLKWAGPLAPITPDVTYYKHGNTKLTWNVGTLAVGEWAELYFTVQTGINPSGKQSYTSPGWYELNSGAALKFRMDGTRYSLEDFGLYINSIWIEVHTPN